MWRIKAASEKQTTLQPKSNCTLGRGCFNFYFSTTCLKKMMDQGIDLEKVSQLAPLACTRLPSWRFPMMGVHVFAY